MSELFGKETGCSKVVAAQCTCSPKSITFLAALPSSPKAFPWHLRICLTSRYKRDALGDASSNAVTAAFLAMGPA